MLYSAGKESTCNAGDLSQSWGWEDPLERGMATHSSVLAWMSDFHIVFPLQGPAGTDAQLMTANVVIFILEGPIQSYCHIRSYLLLGTSIPSG